MTHHRNNCFKQLFFRGLPRTRTRSCLQNAYLCKAAHPHTPNKLSPLRARIFSSATAHCINVGGKPPFACWLYASGRLNLSFFPPGRFLALKPTPLSWPQPRPTWTWPPLFSRTKMPLTCTFPSLAVTFNVLESYAVWGEFSIFVIKCLYCFVCIIREDRTCKCRV